MYNGAKIENLPLMVVEIHVHYMYDFFKYLTLIYCNSISDDLIMTSQLMFHLLVKF